MTFFNPTDEFVDKLVEVIDGRFVVEIGPGYGELLKSLMDRHVKIIGFDPMVNRDELDLEIRTKILPYTIDEVYDFIMKLKENLDTDLVFLVARPCHSGFPQEYLSLFGDHNEMIYIGYAKNLEVDFQRELSLIRFVDFPEHEDCDCVAILERGRWDQDILKAKNWDRVDQRVRDTKGDVSQELIDWILQFKKNNRKDFQNEALIEKYGVGSGSSRSGGDWGDDDWKGATRLSDFQKKRAVKLNISSSAVGGGHFYSTIEVENDELVIKEEDGSITTGRPWEREEGKPDWAKHDNILWNGLKDSKRTSSIEACFEWLKESYEEFKERYQREFSIELIPVIDHGILYELEELGYINS